MFNEGISRISSLIDMGTDFNIIEKKGTWLSFNGQRFQGKEAAKQELKANPSLADEIERLILQKSKEKINSQFAGSVSETVEDSSD